MQGSPPPPNPPKITLKFFNEKKISNITKTRIIQNQTSFLCLGVILSGEGAGGTPAFHTISLLSNCRKKRLNLFCKTCSLFLYFLFKFGYHAAHALSKCDRINALHKSFLKGTCFFYMKILVLRKLLRKPALPQVPLLGNYPKHIQDKSSLSIA